MKDYTLCKEDQANFILDYSKKSSEEIVIKYANGGEFVVDNTIENEKKILEHMKKQILNVDEFFDEKHRRLKLLRRFKIITLVCILAAVILLIFSCITINIIIFLVNLLLICAHSFIFLWERCEEIDILEVLEEAQKNLTFVNNMELFQRGLSKEIKLGSKTTNRTKKVISVFAKMDEKNKYKDERTDILRPTIKDIDKVSYDVFMEVYDLALKNEEFSCKSNNTKKLSRKK